jgi:hypothetical protein
MSDDYRGASFHTTTSGSTTAAILLLEVYNVTRDAQLLYPIFAAISFGLGNQFRSPQTRDRNLFGAVVESVIPASYGTFGWETGAGAMLSDGCPYFLRDISTTFLIHAVALLLELAELE